jgi:hypothetical protein
MTCPPLIIFYKSTRWYVAYCGKWHIIYWVTI